MSGAGLLDEAIGEVLVSKCLKCPSLSLKQGVHNTQQRACTFFQIDEQSCGIL